MFKSILYRFYSSFITFIVSYILTGNVYTSISIGFLDSLVKILSYYYFDEVWKRIYEYKPKPAVIWLTGLSGSGKTSIAYALMAKFRSKSVVPVLLDGDEIRDVIKHYGFDEDSRKKHNLNVGYISSLFEKQGNIVIVSLISPYNDIRNEVRVMCSNFIEVYLSTNLETCIKRDSKGLYQKAIAGEIKEFTGISSPYYPPTNPELTIDTSNLSIDQCAHIIFDYYNK